MWNGSFFFILLIDCTTRSTTRGRSDGVQNKTMEVEEVVLPTLNKFHEIK